MQQSNAVSGRAHMGVLCGRRTADGGKRAAASTAHVYIHGQGVAVCGEGGGGTGSGWGSAARPCCGRGSMHTILALPLCRPAEWES